MLFASATAIPITIFLVIYGIIISEKINRTAISLFGAIVMIILGILNQEQAIEHIDFNTIGLLVGMMIIVNILKRTGVFEYLAIRAAKKAKGDPWKILVLFAIITAVSSAFLDNVTTILLIVPVTLVITDTLDTNPIPFMFTEILIANIGGTATLIGDPPNIMIGSATGLGFVDFIVNLAPVVIVISVATLFLLKLIYKDFLKAKDENKQKIMKMDETITIKDTLLLKKSLIVLFITILGFMVHSQFHLESATIALGGAALLLVISKIDPEEILFEVEWTTIFFFMGLFILVGSLVEVGVIDNLAKKMLELTKGNLFVTTLTILWVSAIASAFLDNIPFVATMIPLIKAMTASGQLDANPLWWALALGACLGGNGTIIGASANVIVTGIMAREGRPVSFMSFMRIGFPMMIVSIIISTIYLILFYV
ncbi:ArsB/NhaD family transporter [Acetoanaerobium noterae]|uniref:SLC13 family permease n=1 Tax=Acetoanaerobium noterae TaxID=745369 RepID=UPI00333E7D07